MIKLQLPLISEISLKYKQRHATMFLLLYMSITGLLSHFSAVNLIICLSSKLFRKQTVMEKLTWNISQNQI